MRGRHAMQPTDPHTMPDSRADAWAALALILIAVLTAVLWVAGR